MLCDAGYTIGVLYAPSESHQTLRAARSGHFRFAKPREPGFQLPVRPTRGTTLLSVTIHIHLRG